MNDDNPFESVGLMAHKMAEEAGEVIKIKSLYEGVANVNETPVIEAEVVKEPVKSVDPVPDPSGPVTDDPPKSTLEQLAVGKLTQMDTSLRKGLADIDAQVDRNRELMKQSDEQLKNIQRNMTALLAQKSIIEQLLNNLNN